MKCEILKHPIAYCINDNNKFSTTILSLYILNIIFIFLLLLESGVLK